jgi:hypothetical protein
MTDDYNIGRGKPPTATRFRKGQSGNPKGRPKGTRNLKTDLEAELGQRIHIKENDLPLQVSKQRALVKTLTAKSLKGDTRAASLLLSMVWRLIDKDPPREPTRDFAAEDQAILDDYLRRQLPRADEETDHE